MQLFSADEVEKTTLKSCSEKLKSTFFSLLPWLPKQPKKKNSCSKMWLIDQLYIELGFWCELCTYRLKSLQSIMLVMWPTCLSNVTLARDAVSCL